MWSKQNRETYKQDGIKYKFNYYILKLVHIYTEKLTSFAYAYPKLMEKEKKPSKENVDLFT
jgi:hypothetical protein